MSCPINFAKLFYRSVDRYNLPMTINITTKHAHDPNPSPPSSDTTFVLSRPEPPPLSISLTDLLPFPLTTFENCYIISTGHGISGPFTFGGVTLGQLLDHYAPNNWSGATIRSGDGFGTTVTASEFEESLLAYRLDGRPLTRQEGLVRLIIPTEQEDALRQVKWVNNIAVF